MEALLKLEFPGSFEPPRYVPSDIYETAAGGLRVSWVTVDPVPRSSIGDKSHTKFSIDGVGYSDDPVP